MFFWAHRYVEIRVRADSVGMFVYMALASLVKRRGSWREVKEGDIIFEGEGVFKVGCLCSSNWREHFVNPFSKAVL